ncbi:MAG TPA: hypothetical protein VGM23_06760 [Armatimonadota bacterium]|jgi:hypothetical protein
MVFFWMVVWGVVLLGLLHLAVPSDYMRRDDAGNGTYYLIWGGAVVGALLVMYHLMHEIGLVQSYLITSTVVICAYIGWRGLAWILHEPWSGDDDDRRRDTDEPYYPPVDGPSLAAQPKARPSVAFPRFRSRYTRRQCICAGAVQRCRISNACDDTTAGSR